MYCLKCGKQVDKTSEYCGSCGTKLSLDDDKQTDSLINPVTEISSSDTKEENNLLLVEAIKAAQRMKKQGAIIFLLGLIFTAISYLSAKEGGTYYVVWGLMFYGTYKFLEGYNYVRNPQALIRKVQKKVHSENQKDVLTGKS